MMWDSLPGGRASLALPRAILRVATEKAGAGMCRNGFFGVNIGLILPRLFKFSETVKKNDVFLHHFPKLTTCRLLGGAVRRRVNQKSPLSIDSELSPYS